VVSKSGNPGPGPVPKTLAQIRPKALKLPIYKVFIILKDVTMTWQKWGSKQVLEKRKTSLSLMEVFSY
jgi:hypothetical protein